MDNNTTKEIVMFRKLINFLCFPLMNRKGVATLNVMSYTGAELDYAIPEKWDKRLYENGMFNAFWGSNKEGKEGSNKPIITKDDFTKEPGDVIHFNVISDLYSAGVTGETTLAGSEDKLSLAQFNLTVDWARNAVAFTKNVQRRVNFETVNLSRIKLEKWLSRFVIDADMFTQLITTESPDTLYSGDATSAATLGSNDTFGVEEIDRIKLSLQRKGALPISAKMKDGENLDTYGIVISEVDEYWLKGDEDWKKGAREAAERGAGNPLFTGAIGMWNGCIIYVHRSVKSGYQVIGSALRPEARLYTTINAGDTGANLVLADASTTKSKLTKFFPATGILRIGTEDLTYTAKSDYGFTISARGANGTTAAAHTAGALVTLRDVSTQIGFGAEVAIRGWALKPTHTTDVKDYGFEQGIGVEAVFGQVAVKDTLGVPKNYLLCKSYANNPGTI
jgi:N4-gp56 family major capsid protein